MHRIQIQFLFFLKLVHTLNHDKMICHLGKKDRFYGLMQVNNYERLLFMCLGEGGSFSLAVLHHQAELTGVRGRQSRGTLEFL